MAQLQVVIQPVKVFVHTLVFHAMVLFSLSMHVPLPGYPFTQTSHALPQVLFEITVKGIHPRVLGSAAYQVGKMDVLNVSVG